MGCRNFNSLHSCDFSERFVSASGKFEPVFFCNAPAFCGALTAYNVCLRYSVGL